MDGAPVDVCARPFHAGTEHIENYNYRRMGLQSTLWPHSIVVYPYNFTYTCLIDVEASLN